MHLPVIRRSQGGGATYLDSDQIFYQIISTKSSAIPITINELFEKILSITVETYKRLRIHADFKPLNDVIVNGKKISGNAASTNGSTTILVGNIILNLNYEQMARVLKVPDEKFRDKMAKSMIDWVTNLSKELNELPPIDLIKDIYKELFQKILDVTLVKSDPTEEEWRIFRDEILPRNLSHEWLYMETPHSSKPGRTVKIAHEVKITEIDYKALKLIRIRAEIKDNYILNIQIRGDFFAIPKEAIKGLEEKLIGCKIEEVSLEKIITSYYELNKFEIPGIFKKDFIQAILKLNS